MIRGRRDNAIWILTSCFALPLVTMSIVWLNRPATHPGRHQPVVQTSAAMMSMPPIHDDDDGAELMEHWDNPPVAREERVQLAGMVVFFVGAGLAASRRRASLRRFYHAR